MTRCKITIPIAPVTKKNSQRIVRARNGRIIPLPSKVFESYQEAAGYYIGGAHMTAFPVNVCARFYMATRRRVDLTNLLEALDDMLVAYNVLPDDCVEFLATHDGSRVFLPPEGKKNRAGWVPRTEVEIITLREVGT